MHTVRNGLRTYTNKHTHTHTHAHRNVVTPERRLDASSGTCTYTRTHTHTHTAVCLVSAGLTISAVMLVTDILVVVIMIVAWELNAVAVVLFFAVFALIDGAFVSANLTKVSLQSTTACTRGPESTCGCGRTRAYVSCKEQRLDCPGVPHARTCVLKFVRCPVHRCLWVVGLPSPLHAVWVWCSLSGGQDRDAGCRS